MLNGFVVFLKRCPKINDRGVQRFAEDLKKVVSLQDISLNFSSYHDKISRYNSNSLIVVGQLEKKG